LGEEQIAIYQGVRWVRLGEYPRLIAESLRRVLAEEGLVSAVRTPFQWVTFSPVVEIESGSYLGQVGLYVPQSMLTAARELLDASLGQEPDAERS
jgi:hypothetical protein